MSCLMVMAGGTGGHVFPALAVANALRDKGTKIVWLGTRRGLEAKVIPANDIAIEWVSVEGIRGKGIVTWLAAPFNLLRAMWQSGKAIRKVQPDCILGMGGFVAGPGGLMAKLLRKPLVVHEQNAIAGLTNKYLAKIANKVLTGFPNVKSLPDHAVWVGNPVRDSIAQNSIAQTQQAAKPNKAIRILVIGGSQGAHSFNEYLPSIFQQLAEPVEIWHQTGKGRDNAVVAAYKTLGLDVKVSEFIDDMAQAYAWADLLVCRSGAMTVAECCAAAKPALFIPFPFSAGDHQWVNANTMVDAGAAYALDNAQLKNEPKIVVERLNGLISDPKKIVAMGAAAKTLYRPHALQDVVAVCEEYLNA